MTIVSSRIAAALAGAALLACLGSASFAADVDAGASDRRPPRHQRRLRRLDRWIA